MLKTIPVLRWQTVGGTLTRLIADIGNTGEAFVIEHRPEQPEDYRWELRIRKSNIAQRGILLHGHPTRAEAQRAAARHVGDE